MNSVKRVLTFFVAGLAVSSSALASETPASIRVLSFKDGHALAVQSELAEFEKAMGIKVHMDLIPAASVASKIMTDQAGRGLYDVYLVDEPYVPQLAAFLRPLSEWPKQTPDTEAKHFVGTALEAGSFEGKAYGLPVNGNVYLPIYRKDLFEDAAEKKAFQETFGRELRPPETATELLEVAKFFHRPPELYGFAPFTKLSEGTTVEFLWLLSLMGSDLVDDKGQLAASASDFGKAFEVYRELLSFSPPGSRSWHHTERMRAYSRGQVAYMMTWPSFLRDLEDPAKSLVAGKTGYAKAPHAPATKGAGSSAVSGTWTIALSRKAGNPDAGAQFAYWWAGSKSGAKLVSRGMNPARRDLLSDISLVRDNPWFPVVLENFESAKVRPRIKDYKKLSQMMSSAFTRAVSLDTNGKTCAPCQSIALDLEGELKTLMGR